MPCHLHYKQLELANNATPYFENITSSYSYKHTGQHVSCRNETTKHLYLKQTVNSEVAEIRFLFSRSLYFDITALNSSSGSDLGYS